MVWLRLSCLCVCMPCTLDGPVLVWSRSFEMLTSNLLSCSSLAIEAHVRAVRAIASRRGRLLVAH